MTAAKSDTEGTKRQILANDKYGADQGCDGSVKPGLFSGLKGF